MKTVLCHCYQSDEMNRFVIAFKLRFGSSVNDVSLVAEDGNLFFSFQFNGDADELGKTFLAYDASRVFDPPNEISSSGYVSLSTEMTINVINELLPDIIGTGDVRYKECIIARDAEYPVIFMTDGENRAYWKAYVSFDRTITDGNGIVLSRTHGEQESGFVVAESKKEAEGKVRAHMGGKNSDDVTVKTLNVEIDKPDADTKGFFVSFFIP